MVLLPDHPKNERGGWRIIAFLTQIEEFFLAGLLLIIILLSCYQICLRWAVQGGLSWIDPLLRYLVLWGGLLGAALATARDNHISMDVVGYLLNERARQWLALLIQLFCVVIASLLVRATILFLQSEYEFGGNALFGLPSWTWNLIFPIAFILICLHFIINAIHSAVILTTSRRDHNE